jgi:hypothetical protein
MDRDFTTVKVADLLQIGIDGDYLMSDLRQTCG